jgi:hypothetical protein
VIRTFDKGEAKRIHERQTILSSERILHKSYDRKGSFAKKKKKISGRESQGAWRQDELIDGKSLVVK